MFTSIDKALISTVTPVVYWVNIMFFGGELNVEEVSNLIIPIIVSIVPFFVWLFPNAGFRRVD